MKLECKVEVNTMLVTTKDYSTHVGLPIRTLRRWCRSGVVPAIRVGRTYYLDPDKADQAIADMKVTAERPKANVEPKKVRRHKQFDFLQALEQA